VNRVRLNTDLHRLDGSKTGNSKSRFLCQASPNRSADRAFALAASSSRLLGGAVVSSEWRRRVQTAATSSMAVLKEASLALEGLLKPLIFRTNCREASRISASVTGGSKLKRFLMFLHMGKIIGALGKAGLPFDFAQASSSGMTSKKSKGKSNDKSGSSAYGEG
jgi:hypothetical protein